MAMLNAPTMQCDRVNLRRSASVQKRQQIFETVPVRHRGAPLSDEVAPLPEQVEPHYSTVPFRKIFVNAAKQMLRLGLKVRPERSFCTQTSSRPDTTRRGPRRLRHPRRSRLMFSLQTTYGM